MSGPINDIWTFVTTGTIPYFGCGFAEADSNWYSCIANTSRILPAAFIAGFWGTVKLISTQWGFMSTLDTPPYEGDVAGTQNVAVFYYVLDTFFESFWLLVELTFIQAIVLISAFSLIGFNIWKGTFVWNGIIGLAQLTALIFWDVTMVFRLVYNFVNFEYLINKYDL